MKTTVTIDDELAATLQKMAGQQGRSFDEVVNDVLRAGLLAQGEVSPQRKPVKVVPRALGLKAGYDPDKLNQLVDQLEADEFMEKQRKL